MVGELLALSEVEDGGVVLQTTWVDLAAQEQPLVFEPFCRASNRPTAGEASTGLGLAIVERIVEAHRGTIGVVSEAGAGSTFTLSLPAPG